MNPFLTGSLGLLSSAIGGAQPGHLGSALGGASLGMFDLRRQLDQEEEERKKKEALQQQAQAMQAQRQQAFERIQSVGDPYYSGIAQQALATGDDETLGKIFSQVTSPEYEQYRSQGLHPASGIDRTKAKNKEAPEG